MVPKRRDSELTLLIISDHGHLTRRQSAWKSLDPIRSYNTWIRLRLKFIICHKKRSGYGSIFYDFKPNSNRPDSKIIYKELDFIWTDNVLGRDPSKKIQLDSRVNFAPKVEFVPQFRRSQQFSLATLVSSFKKNSCFQVQSSLLDYGLSVWSIHLSIVLPEACTRQGYISHGYALGDVAH